MDADVAQVGAEVAFHLGAGAVRDGSAAALALLHLLHHVRLRQPHHPPRLAPRLGDDALHEGVAPLALQAPDGPRPRGAVRAVERGGDPLRLRPRASEEGVPHGVRFGLAGHLLELGGLPPDGRVLLPAHLRSNGLPCHQPLLNRG